MADKPAIKAAEPISVQNKEVQDRANARMIQEAMEQESMDQEKKPSPLKDVTLIAAGAPGLAPAAAVLQPKLVSRSGSSMPMLRVEEAGTIYDIAWANCPTAKVALDAVQEWWKLSSRLKRFDLVHVHDEFFAWECLVRVMKIDKELQCVIVDVVGDVTVHKITAATGIDFAQLKIVHRGVVGKWSVVSEPDSTRARVMQEGFETEAAAQQWLLKKKAA